MNSIWETVTSIGVRENRKATLNKRVKLTNQVSFSFSCIASTYVFILYFLGMHHEGLLVILVVAAILAPLLFNYFRWYVFARMWFIVALNGAVLGYSWLLGKDSGLPLIFLGCSCVPWVLFSVADWKYLIICTTLAAAAYYGYCSTDGLPHTYITASVQHYIYFSTTGVIFLGLSLCIGFLAWQNHVSEQSLVSTNVTLKKAQREIQQAANRNNTLIEFAEVARNNSKTLNELCNAGLTHLCKKLNCGYGAVLVFDKHDNLLTLTAEAGSSSDGKRKLVIKPGLGLAGDAFQRQKLNRITNAPANYIYSIKSGLGSRSPADLVIFPLTFNQHRVGVLELATFNVFSDGDMTLIKKIADEFAAMILTAKSEMDLLSMGKQAADKLHAQLHDQEMRYDEYVKLTRSNEEKLLLEIEQLKLSTKTH